MTAGTFNVNVSGPSIHVMLRVSLPSSPRTCFRRTKQTKESKLGTCTIVLCTGSSGVALRGQITSAFPRGRCVLRMCRRLRCCCRVTVNSKFRYVHRFGLRRFYEGFGCFPIPISDTLGVLARTNCLRCASRRSGTSHVLFAVQQSRLCGLQRVNARTRALVRAVLHSCAKMFASCTCVDRSALTVHAKLAHRRVCGVLIALAGHHVMSCVPRGGAPCVVCAHRQLRLHCLRVPTSICRRHGTQCRTHVGTVRRCIASRDIYQDQVLLHCFKRGGRRGYGRYSIYLGHRRASYLPRSSFERVEGRVLRLLAQGDLPPTKVTGTVRTRERSVDQMVRCLLRRNRLGVRSKVLRVSGWIVAFTSGLGGGVSSYQAFLGLSSPRDRGRQGIGGEGAAKGSSESSGVAIYIRGM